MDELTALACRAKSDADAFSELVQRLNPLLGSLAQKYWIPYETDDEVAQVLRIELWNAVRSFRKGQVPFLPFAKMFVENRMKTMMKRRVYGAKYMFMNQMKRVEEQGPLNDQGEPLPAATPAVEEDVIHELVLKAARERLYELLEQLLTDLERECFVRRYIYEQSYREISEELDLISVKAVDNAIARVKKKMMNHPAVVELWNTLAG
ncbi:MAG: sigma-70 family RNA polymerase sigma factor [Alicyclobacillaceae bacterium]|nr:sigma-70 family RNA polymerase sigma factor [Alicyclobacillaceae bacterium]